MAAMWVEIGAAQRAAGGKRANALATAGADVGTDGSHDNDQTTGSCGLNQEPLSGS
jgi:hypothetical protein